jgi:hypothetical protein
MRFVTLLLVSCMLATPVAAQDADDVKILHRMALKILNQLQKPSISQNRELCGVFYKRADGHIFASRVVTGMEATCAPPRDNLPGSDVIATFHTHGPHSRAYDAEVPSLQDLQGDIAAGTFGYVSTPGGRVWFIHPTRETAELLCDVGCVHADPRYNPRDTRQIARRYSLSKLASR